VNLELLSVSTWPSGYSRSSRNPGGRLSASIWGWLGLSCTQVEGVLQHPLALGGERLVDVAAEHDLDLGMPIG
jgi:hypothetical protein